MEKKNDLEIVYSTEFHLIGSAKPGDCCIHLICLSGEGCFRYNNRPFRIKKNDAAIISRPELVEIISQTGDLQVEILAAPHKFLNSRLPANNYGIGGSISLFDNPVMSLSEENAEKLLADIHNIRDRSGETGHLFYRELMESLALTMVYDLFHFHAESHTPIFATDRSMYVVKSLMALLESGRNRKYREVAYYANLLNVTPKYLSDTVKRQTGKSVTYYIDRHTVPMIRDYLNNPDLSISQIADEMNFTSISYFSRYVTKHLGMSPKSYRLSLVPTDK